MAERSGEERIHLWYQQLHQALTTARNDFLRLTQYPRLDTTTYQEQFAEAVARVAGRADYLRDNPAEVVADRLAVLAEKAREALQNAPRIPQPELTPAERRIDEAIERITSADYQGQLAEERFYAEQDPASDWYREDLYHGEMGPDVAIDRAEPEQLPGGAHGYDAPEEMNASDLDNWDDEWDEQPTLSEQLAQLRDRLTQRQEQDRDQGMGY